MQTQDIREVRGVKNTETEQAIQPLKQPRTSKVKIYTFATLARNKTVLAALCTATFTLTADFKAFNTSTFKLLGKSVMKAAVDPAMIVFISVPLFLRPMGRDGSFQNSH